MKSRTTYTDPNLILIIISAILMGILIVAIILAKTAEGSLTGSIHQANTTEQFMPQTHSFELGMIRPQSFHQSLYLSMKCEKEMKIKIKMINSTGKKIHESFLNCLNGFNSFYYIQESPLPAGNYLISFEDSLGYKTAVAINKK